MKLLTIGLFIALVTMQSQAAETIKLWEGPAPGARGQSENDTPTLTIYLPEKAKATGAAMVICPGGGYGGLAQHEGKDYAEWLTQNGVAGFVLKYRLGSHGYRHPIMLRDAARAMRYVRANAAKWNVDGKKIGIMGSSAGGHLASTLLTHFDSGNSSAEDAVDRQSSRPDLGILCYPVITMGDFTHAGSKRNLLGTDPSPDLVKLLSNEQQVTTNTPPTFLWHTWEDTAVVPQNSIAFAHALGAAKVPYELHIYEKGRHGIGLANGHQWTKACLEWLKLRGFVK